MSDITEPEVNPEGKANSTVMNALLGGAAKPAPPAPAVDPQDADEDDDLHEDGVEDADENESQEDEQTEDELPQAVKDILAKNRKELREAKAEARRAAKELADLKNGEPNPDVEAAKASENTYKDLYITTSAKAALAEAGLTSGTDRMTKLIDFSAVEIDPDGTVSGLQEQVDALKEDFPELFAVKAPRRTTVKADVGGGKPPAPEPKKSSADKIAAAMMGR